MKPAKLIFATATMALVSSVATAAIRPSTAQITTSPILMSSAAPMAGTRLGATTATKRSDLTGTGTALVVLGVAAAGVGIAAAAGAFDSNHGSTSP